MVKICYGKPKWLTCYCKHIPVVKYSSLEIRHAESGDGVRNHNFHQKVSGNCFWPCTVIYTANVINGHLGTINDRSRFWIKSRNIIAKKYGQHMDMTLQTYANGRQWLVHYDSKEHWGRHYYDESATACHWHT